MALTPDKVFGSDFYSGTGENIERILNMIEIGGGRLASLTDEDLAIYQEEVDRLINSRLSPYYAVPLAKDIGGFFPFPIPFIAARIVAADIIHNEFTEIEANKSEAALTMKRNALDELDRLTMGARAGTQRLEGQRVKSRDRFPRPTIIPLTQPPETGGGRPLA